MIRNQAQHGTIDATPSMNTEIHPAAAPESLWKRLLSRLLPFRQPESAEAIGQEIQEILEEGEEQGLISPEEGKMIASILEFKDTLAHEIMTPRSDMVMAEARTPVPELIRLIIDRGYSRIPVYTETPEQMVGILHAKDLLPSCLDGARTATAGELARTAWFVQENRKIVELLKFFQTQKIHMAIVTDEFGAVRGLITLEDVVEEIVGEIGDEYDKSIVRWKVVDDHTVLTDAKVDLEEVERFFRITFPEGPYGSVGGLILRHLDRVPTAGTSMMINGLVFEVVAADKRRIITVKIQKKR
ncbi:MAG: hemolysin family protein [Thermodesulfobacteriota bacterium]